MRNQTSRPQLDVIYIGSPSAFSAQMLSAFNRGKGRNSSVFVFFSPLAPLIKIY